MMGVCDFTDCKVIIRDDKTEQTLAETKVVEYDNKTVTLFVDGRFFEDFQGDQVSLLLLHPSGIFEFKGIVRKKSASGLQSISMFKGKGKENRSSKRYMVNSSAEVDCLVVSGKLVSLAKTIPVTVVNLSATGMLIRAPLYSFNVRTAFQCKILNGESELTVIATVVRIKNLDSERAEFGCELVSAI